MAPPALIRPAHSPSGKTGYGRPPSPGGRRGCPPPGGARDLGGRSVWIFLARAVSLRKPRFKGVGLPWISLDSLVRIETYQWVTRDFVNKFFLSLFPVSRIAETGARGRGMRKRRIAHQANLNQVPLFRKKMSTLIAIAVDQMPAAAKFLRRCVPIKSGDGHDEGSVQGVEPQCR
jgi:hypothetical protein